MGYLSDDLRTINDVISRNKVRTSTDISVECSASGTRLFLVDKNGKGSGGGKSASAVLCVITGGTTISGYTVDIYENGYAAGVTGTGYLIVPLLSISTNLPVGYIVWALKTQLIITGGS